MTIRFMKHCWCCGKRAPGFVASDSKYTFSVLLSALERHEHFQLEAAVRAVRNTHAPSSKILDKPVKVPQHFF
jgi:hypothetical protein